MHAMTDREESRKLNGLVQIDDAYLSGERNGGKVGRGPEQSKRSLSRSRLATIWNAPDMPSSSRSVALTMLLSMTGRSDNCSRMPRFTLTDCSLSSLLSTPVARKPSSKLAAGAQRPEAQGAIGQHRAVQREALDQWGLPFNSPGQYARRYIGEAAYPSTADSSEKSSRLVHAMINCKPKPGLQLRLTSNFRQLRSDANQCSQALVQAIVPGLKVHRASDSIRWPTTARGSGVQPAVPLRCLNSTNGAPQRIGPA